MVNLEPVNGQIKRTPPDFYLPSLNMGAELANMTCSFPSIDFEMWYSHLQCPKVMMEVAVSSVTVLRRVYVSVHVIHFF